MVHGGGLEGHIPVTTFEADFGVAAGTHSPSHTIDSQLSLPLGYYTCPFPAVTRKGRTRSAPAGHLSSGHTRSCRCGGKAAPPAPARPVPAAGLRPPRPPCCPPTGETQMSLAVASTWRSVGTLVRPLPQTCLLGARGRQFYRAQGCQGGK